MISGRDALHQIDRAIKQARDNVDRTADATEDEQRRLFDIRKNEASLYQKISSIRLKSLGAQEEGVDALGIIDNRASRLIEEHESHLQKLEEAREKAENHLEICETNRVQAAQTLTNLITKHEEASEKTRARLDKDPHFIELAQAVEKANAIVDHAASKREVATHDRVEKGKPYEDDPLFAYLWKRKFATSEYKAGPISTMLDRWVAKLIKYRDARLNYERLLDIPERLNEHVAYVEEKAITLAEEIEAYERKALEDDGVTILRDKVTEQRTQLDRLDTEIIQAETAYHTALSALEQANYGHEGPLQKALTILSDALQERTIPDLKILAAETLTPEDDGLVEELAELRLERFALEEEQQAFKRRLQSHQISLTELEKLRRRFKQARFDSHRSEFKNDDLISLLLSDFVRGVLSSGEVWRKIERSHRLRRRDWQDDFGGDDWREGFGLPSHRQYNDRSRGPDKGHNWGRIGRDISREIERELGRTLRGGLDFDLDDLFDLEDMFEGGRKRSKHRHTHRSPRHRSRRRPRSVSRTPRTRPTRRRSKSRGRKGSGGFKTGGGF